MKKIILIFTLLFTICLFAEAQLRQIARGNDFTEPEAGYAKILQMKNGNTLFVHLTLTDGINVRIYDANHIEKIVTNNTPKYGKLLGRETVFGGVNEYIYGMFEINNDLVIFIGTQLRGGTKLYRLIIDGTTGKLKDDTVMADMAGGNIIVQKDYLQDHYALLIYGRLVTGTEVQKKILLFGSDHKEIIAANFDNVPKTDKDFDLSFVRDMLVVNDQVFVFYYFEKSDFKSKNGSRPPGITCMSVLEKGKTSSAYIPVKLPMEISVWDQGIKYNPVTKKIYVFTLEDNRSESYKKSYKYNTFFTIIDPETKKIQHFEDIVNNEKVNEAYKERFSTKSDYYGLPQNLYIDDEGSFSLICEENHSINSDGIKNNWISKVLQINFDKNGAYKSGYVIPKSHTLFKISQSPFARMRWEAEGQQLNYGFQYKTFIYLEGKLNKYILYNDVQRNNNVKGDKYASVTSVADCDSYIYKLAGEELIPKKEYAFGEPAAREHNVAVLSVSDYDKKNNILVTLMLNRESPKNTTVRLVWLQPQ